MVRTKKLELLFRNPEKQTTTYLASILLIRSHVNCVPLLSSPAQKLSLPLSISSTQKDAQPYTIVLLRTPLTTRHRILFFTITLTSGGRVEMSHNWLLSMKGRTSFIVLYGALMRWHRVFQDLETPWHTFGWRKVSFLPTMCRAVDVHSVYENMWFRSSPKTVSTFLKKHRSHLCCNVQF